MTSTSTLVEHVPPLGAPEAAVLAAVENDRLSTSCDLCATRTGPGRPTARNGTCGLDAVEFCRTVSGRAPGAGLLTQVVPF